MERLSSTYSTVRSVNYFVQSREETCKQLDNCKDKPREGQKKLRKSSSHFEQLVSPKILKYSSQYQRKDIDSEQRYTHGPHHTTNATQMEQLTSMINNSSSYVQNLCRKRRIQRQISRSSRLNLIRQIRKLPRQNTQNSFENQFFNGASFY